MRRIILSMFTVGCAAATTPEDTKNGAAIRGEEELEAVDPGDEFEDGPQLEDGEDFEDDEDTEDAARTIEYETISSLPAGVSEFTLEQEVAGQMEERRFLVHTPVDFDDSQSVPLLFAFHGNGGAPESFVYEIAAAVEDGNFIGVYPAGLASSWNLGPEASEADDVAFTEAVLGMLTGTAGVDATKPVALGFSNGAGMVHELAMESDPFVAISPAVSHLLATKTPGTDAAPVSVLQFSGTEDGLVPYNGGIGVMDHNFLPAEDSTAEWAMHNGCDATPTTGPDIAGPDIEEAPGEYTSTSYTVLEWENCATGARVVHVRMNDIGHDLPYEMIDGGTMPFIYRFLLDARQ